MKKPGNIVEEPLQIRPQNQTPTQHFFPSTIMAPYIVAQVKEVREQPEHY